jgi:hypothetical protein
MIPVIDITDTSKVRTRGAAWAIDFENRRGVQTEFVGGSVGEVRDGKFFVKDFVLANRGGFGGAVRAGMKPTCGNLIVAETPVEATPVVNAAVIKKGFFTVESATDSRHRTFRIKTSPRTQKTVIGLMTGSNNLKDYTWFGYINGSDIRFWRTAYVGSGWERVEGTLPISQDEIRECFAAITNNTEAAGLRFAREYQNCSRCGIVLTTPESLDRGLGPECVKIRYGGR